MVMPRPSSAALQSIRRELQRRKHKAALAPARPASKKTSAPPLREEARDQEFRAPRPRSTREEDPPSSISRSSGSADTSAPPPRRPRPSSTVSAPPTPPPRSVPPSIGYASAAARNTSTGHLNPGTAVLVRTRSQMVIDGRTLVLWLPATVVSSAADGGYEVIYEGNLPRDNPFSTVRAPLHHVRAVKPSRPPSGLCAAASTIIRVQTAPPPKNQGTRPAPRPTTAGKSLRILSNRVPEMEPAPRPTTAGKSISVIRGLMSQKERQALDAYCLGY